MTDKEKAPILTILTSEQAEEEIRNTILVIKRRVERPVRFGSRQLGLFKITEEELGDVCGESGIVGRLEREELQRVGLRTMREFADLKDPHEIYPYILNIPRQRDCVSRRYFVFPSKTPGMNFEKFVKSYTDSDRLIEVSWAVADNASVFALHVRGLLERPSPRRGELVAA